MAMSSIDCILSLNSTCEKSARGSRPGFSSSAIMSLSVGNPTSLDTYFCRSIFLRMSASFGGGIGRMRLTCGTACGMFMLAGLETGSTDPSDRLAKGANYAAVQELAARFKAINGSLTCAELLGLKKDAPTPSMPEARTPDYYKRRPCLKMVETAATIFAEFLASRRQTSGK